MKIRLVHTQALLLLSAILLAVFAMGALSAWNLRKGFTDYLVSRDLERLEQFASLVSENAERAGGLDAMESGGTEMPELFHQFGKLQGRLPAPELDDEFGRPRPPPEVVGAFKDRVVVVDLAGHPRLGRPLPEAMGAYVERPVYVRKEVVALVRMTQLKPVPDEVELQFLNTQYRSIVVVAVVLLLIALAGAYWVSGHWVRPLMQVQTATQHIAQGRFDTRLDARRGDEIGDTMRNINQMAESLKKLEGARRQWIAEISHELRTPLTVLRGELDGLMEGVIAVTPQAIQSLHEETLRLHALVDDLHLLAMADLKALPCYFESFDAVPFLEGVVQRFQMRATQSGLALQLHWAQEGPVWVRWDEKRIEQLLVNLMNNSLLYTDAPGQILVHASCGDEADVCLEVQDSAPGVSNEDLTRIFEPLYRADVSRARSTGGSGLGLAICAQIVKAHHGTIRVEHSALGGMKFQIQLPREGDVL